VKYNNIFYSLFTISETFSEQMKTSTIVIKTLEHIRNMLMNGPEHLVLKETRKQTSLENYLSKT